MAAEIGDDEEPPILREHLARRYPKIGVIVGVTKTATLDELATIAHRHPVFHIDPASSGSPRVRHRCQGGCHRPSPAESGLYTRP